VLWTYHLFSPEVSKVSFGCYEILLSDHYDGNIKLTKNSLTGISMFKAVHEAIIFIPGLRKLDILTHVLEEIIHAYRTEFVAVFLMPAELVGWVLYYPF